MGHNSNVKLLRKQIRNVAQEQLPQALSDEVRAVIFKDLKRDLDQQMLNLEQEWTKRLDTVEEYIKSRLDEMAERAKNAQDMIIRQVATIPNVQDPLKDATGLDIKQEAPQAAETTGEAPKSDNENT